MSTGGDDEMVQLAGKGGDVSVDLLVGEVVLVRFVECCTVSL